MEGPWVSVDGAKKLSGVALWDGADLVETAAVSGLAYDDWRVPLVGSYGLVIEDGYVGKSRKTGIVLGHARGKIEGFAESLGCPLLASYQPSVWRRRVGVPGSTRAAQKQAARAMCRWLALPPDDRPSAKAGSAFAGVHLPVLADIPTADECEAVLIGLAHLVATGVLK